MVEVTQNPIFRFLYWMINTPGVGAVTLAIIGISLVTCYGNVLRWIAKGVDAKDMSVYAYPTESLHEQES